MSEIEQVPTITEDLNKYSIYAKEGEYITVTEWANGEGWNIDINDRIQFNLNACELEAINYLTQKLRYESK